MLFFSRSLLLRPTGLTSATGWLIKQPFIFFFISQAMPSLLQPSLLSTYITSLHLRLSPQTTKVPATLRSPGIKMIPSVPAFQGSFSGRQ